MLSGLDAGDFAWANPKQADTFRRVPVADGMAAPFTSQAIWAAVWSKATLFCLAEASALSCPSRIFIAALDEMAI